MSELSFRAQQNRYRTVVQQLYLHLSLEDAGFDYNAFLA
jgi:hypothetical protein